MTKTKSPFDPDESLSAEQLRREQTKTPKPMIVDTTGESSRGYRAHPSARVFVRGPWELAASVIIGIGVLMLMQPFFMWAYTYSFIVTLIGTVMFIVVSHFPE